MRKRVYLYSFFILLLFSCTKTYTKNDFVYEGIDKGNIELMKACIEQGFNVHEDYVSYQSYLMMGAKSGFPDVVTFLLGQALDVNSLYDILEMDSRFLSESGRFLIWENRLSALAYGIEYPAITKILLEHGADPNALLGEGFSTLMFAINCLSDINNREVKPDILESMRLLLEYGANPNYYGEQTGMSPLLLALNYKLREAVDLFLEYGARPSERMVQIRLPEQEELRRKYYWLGDVFYQSELHMMAYAGYADLLMPYIKSGRIKPANKTPDGADYFYFAAEGGSPEMLMALLPYLKNINAPRYSFKGIHNMTLIFVAGYHENLEAVKVLLENGANPDIEAYYAGRSAGFRMTSNTSPAILNIVVDYKGGWLHFPEYTIR
jgi:ankyrin repeat protein